MQKDLNKQVGFFKIFSLLGFKQKLMGIMLLIAVGTIVSLSYMFMQKSKNSLEKLSIAQLVSTSFQIKRHFEEYFVNAKQFTERLQTDRLVEGLFLSFEGSFYGDSFDIGEDHDIYTAAYQKLEKKYSVRMITTLETFKLKNMLLAGTHGQVIYSARTGEKFPYLGKNLVEGSLKNTELARCFNQANEANDVGDASIIMSRFEYSKIMNEVTAYLCVKQFAEFDHLSEGINKGDVMGVIISRIDMNYIDSLVSSREGMG